MLDDPFDELDQRLREERRQTTAERNALETFARRVQRVQTVATPSTPAVLVERTADNSLTAIMDAYRETVMAVPHYEEEYGMHATADVAEELGPGIAATLVESVGLDESTKRAVLLSTAESHRSRKALLKVLDAERASLDSVTPRLRAIADELESISSIDFDAETFGALDAYRGRIDTLRNKCDVIAATRQEDVQRYRNATVGTGTVESIPRYLYQWSNHTYPVLAYIAGVGEFMDALNGRLGRAVSQHDNDYGVQKQVGGDARQRTEL